MTPEFFDKVTDKEGRACTHDLFINSAHDPAFKAVAKRIAETDDQNLRQTMKRNGVPVITWQASYVGHRRSNQNAIPTGLYALDIDHTDDKTPEVIRTAMGLIKECDIVYIGRSISGKGVRIVAECRPEFSSLAECQQWLAGKLGVEYDGACKDWARASYIVPEEYIEYMDYGIFLREAKCVYDGLPSVAVKGQESRVESQGAEDNRLGWEPSVEPLPPSAGGAAEGGEKVLLLPAAAKPTQQAATSAQGGSYKGLRLADIAGEWLEATGGIPVEGERNTRLYNLAYAMRYITDFNPETIAANIPHCGLNDAEVLAFCKSACSGPRSTSMPRKLAEVLETMQRQQQFENEAAGEEEMPDIEEFADVFNTDQIPPLPPIFKQWHDAAPEDFKQAVVLCLLPMLGTLGSKLRANYMDGEPHSPSFQVTLEAPQAQGKSFVKKMDERCLGKLKAEDAIQREREREWKERRAELRDLKKGAKKEDVEKLNKEKPETLIRYISATASITELLKKMYNAKGLHLYSFSPEIDTVYKAMRRDFSNFSDILRKSFDGDEHGQDYSSENSWSGIVKLYLNTIYCGTPKKVRRFYPDVEDGTTSRVLFVTFPDQSFKPLAKFRPFTASENAIMDLMLAKLSNVSIVDGEVMPDHLMQMDFLVEKLRLWCLAQQSYAAKQQDHTRDTFCRRCSVMGFRAGILAYFLLDEVASKKVKKQVCDFAVWVANCALREFLSRFDLNEEGSSRSFKYKELYNAMPEEFDYEDIRREAAKFDIQTKPKQICFCWRMAKRVDWVSQDKSSLRFKKL